MNIQKHRWPIYFCISIAIASAAAAESDCRTGENNMPKYEAWVATNAPKAATSPLAKAYVGVMQEKIPALKELLKKMHDEIDAMKEAWSKDKKLAPKIPGEEVQIRLRYRDECNKYSLPLDQIVKTPL